MNETSTTNITQESLETAQLIPPPLGNYQQISECQELVDSYVTMSQEEIKPLITVLDPTSLLSEARNFLRNRLESIGFATDSFYKVVEVDREPKFVVDILITIPKFDRKKKFAVLSEIANMMKKYPNLLFNFRFLKKKEIPDEYTAI